MQRGHQVYDFQFRHLHALERNNGRNKNKRGRKASDKSARKEKNIGKWTPYEQKPKKIKEIVAHAVRWSARVSVTITGGRAKKK